MGWPAITNFPKTYYELQSFLSMYLSSVGASGMLPVIGRLGAAVRR
jgi:hypothetical protein